MLFGQLPQCNMYHFTFVKAGDDYRLSNPKMLTAFNQTGYNNQPSFYEDDVVYFTTDYYGGDQTEIAKFDFFTREMTRITYTSESEYSPIRIPGSEEFSTVRVELNGNVQSLSVYPQDGIGYPKRYVHNTNNIGYHAWLDEENLALFLVEEPYHNLAIANAKTERRKIILDKIGRCLKVDRQGNLLFVHKLNELKWFIKSYDTDTNQSKLITETMPGSEDFEVLNNGSILMGSGSQLFLFNPQQKEKGWIELADLGLQGISNISRIISNKNRLIVVDQAAE